ncbi:MAG TPA: hypothetical protein VK722_10480 [Candidatus Aquilonibacter sp.]|jgi:hypothetical protein|nr:hypothetical protein [Candidatus Aquilonibacter sp.]
MKTRWICAACFLAFACSVASAFGQQLDVLLDGPWIYQVDTQFHPGGHANMPVLIAMAPSVPGHTGPTFTTGDGADLTNTPGVFCVSLGGLGCAVSTSNATDLNSTPYTALYHLPIHAKGGASPWAWYQYASDASRARSSWYIILPIPDSASNDGVEGFYFGSTFGIYPNPAQSQNIGTMLHYKDSQGAVSLYKCTGSSGTYGDNCTTPQFQKKQPNTGTLRISFSAPDDKAPYNVPYCDYHIRDAYHSSMLFLDETQLDLGTNTNQAYGYADLPPADSDPAQCYPCDSQNPHGLGNCAYMEAMSPDSVDVRTQLADIVNAIGGRKDRDGLQYAELQSISEQLKGQLPQRSQLLSIQRLLHLSKQGIENLYLQEFEVQKKAKTKEIATPSQDILVLKRMEDDLDVHILRAASGGKDCRAAQMRLPNN